ncbi:hypothetical protein Slin15195_G074110 [Septoria linicola]|uniref:Uncharacterized protein n=1 Tax=Septoria linicola TaxID=215465 RepID=A0A9Q9EL80_9PEZI|nr:hypothetical protein Slin15195_G074110 [Septoria linicola]
MAMWRQEARASKSMMHIRAAYILRLQGRDVDAAFLDQHAEACDRRTWQYRFVDCRKHRDDPKLEQLHRESPHVQEIWDAFAREEAESTKPSQIQARELDRREPRARPSFPPHASGTKVFRFSPSIEKRS